MFRLGAHVSISGGVPNAVELGEAGFERFVNHDRLRDLPMVLETPADDRGYAWNIETVRELRQE